jgi:hypothetical protein
MEKTAKLYFLYCLNRQCHLSIYHFMLERAVPLTARNLAATYLCTCCGQPLVSSMVPGNEPVVINSKSQVLGQREYPNN